MANTLTTLTNTALALRAVQAARTALAPIFGFSTDFTADAVQRGDKVKVLYVPNQDAAIDFAGTYTMQDGDASGLDITIDKHKFVSWGFSDQELANRPQLSLEALAVQKGHALGKAILLDILSQVTNANYSTAAFVGAASTFDADDVADIRKACVDAGMPDSMRILALTPAYVAALLKDGAIQGADSFGQDSAIRNGIVGRLMGFDIIETPNIPANGENLVGMAAFPTGMFVASRVLIPPATAANVCSHEVITEPETGLSFGLREWYDNDTGTTKRVLECAYGYRVGDTGMVKRLTSS